MVSVAKVITSKGASEVVEKAGELIKSKDKNKLKKAEDLLTKEKKKIKIDKQEVDVSKDGKTTTIVDVDKKAFKVKKPTEISDFEAQDLLLKYNANKLTPKVLSDFNIKNMKSEKDILNFIEIISKKYSKEIKTRKRDIQDHEQTKKLATLIGKDGKIIELGDIKSKSGVGSLLGGMGDMPKEGEVKKTRIEKLDIPLIPGISEDLNILNALMGDMDGKVDEETKQYYLQIVGSLLVKDKKLYNILADALYIEFDFDRNKKLSENIKLPKHVTFIEEWLAANK